MNKHMIEKVFITCKDILKTYIFKKRTSYYCHLCETTHEVGKYIWLDHAEYADFVKLTEKLF